MIQCMVELEIVLDDTDRSLFEVKLSVTNVSKAPFPFFACCTTEAVMYTASIYPL